jgi:hypothetical protein
MRYADLIQGLHEADDVAAYMEKNKYGNTKFGTWDIRYNNFPNAKGIYGAIAVSQRDEKVFVKAEGESSEAAVEAVKGRIEFMNKVNDTVQKYTKANLCFNVEFTRDVLADGITGVRLVGHGDSAYLLVAKEEWADKFVRLQERTPNARYDQDGGGAARLFGAKITANQVKRLGLQPNGRYALDYVDEDEFARKYRLVYDSVTKGPQDKVRLYKPGVTVAVY